MEKQPNPLELRILVLSEGGMYHSWIAKRREQQRILTDGTIRIQREVIHICAIEIPCFRYKNTTLVWDFIAKCTRYIRLTPDLQHDIWAFNAYIQTREYATHGQG